MSSSPAGTGLASVTALIAVSSTTCHSIASALPGSTNSIGS
ncbi:MAG TPA: hypothetical protein VFD94_09545 [Jatrophihabitans sp.]|nr:hypothetical protein [Jatrophihabitans sp.]